SAVDRSIAELIVAGLVRTLRAFGCAQSDIHAVCFEHTTPAYHYAYTAAFAGAERFAQPFTGVEFAAHALDRLHIHRRPELQSLLRAQAEHSMQQLSLPPSCTDQVRALIRRQRPGQSPEMARAARELGLSVRSLRRRLFDEGTTFRALAQSVLQEAACALLRDRDASLQNIAHAVGFNDPTAFHRAFKRWVGLTPAEYRESTTRATAIAAIH
ncbi:MAG TPA: helix-turn-helix domain-containing protein, partial [Polyangiales bacterium]|nr:helix-turn-helix domain-containing protein [Polyangiales bacterium]